MVNKMDTIMVRIKRSNKSKGSWYQKYKIKKLKGMTVLGALIYIHDYLDETLAIDYNCRAGKCGTCGVLVDGKPTLACETQVHDNIKELTIEPKRNHKVKRDLFSEDPSIWIIRKEILEKFPFTAKSEPPFIIPPHMTERYNKLDGCIECGLCQAACPNISKGWIGPMHAVYAAKLDSHPLDILDRSELLMERGARLCDTNFGCQNICPKGITITQDAIIPEKEAWLNKNGLVSKIFGILKGQ